MKIYKGHVFAGPHGQGYRLKSDLNTGDILKADMFEAFGGAPAPAPNTPMPKWLDYEIKNAYRVLHMHVAKQ
jgi:hypothetical protein